NGVPARMSVCVCASLCVCESHSANMPSDLERTMETLITVFHRYADKDGDSNTLSKRELKELMEKELSSFLKSQKDPGAIDKIMRDLDQNGDGQVSFEEFVSLVVGLSIACEQCYQLHIKKQQGKK
uniref:Protein S100 n=1 Tax=Lepisosteus oculatus TaxID=7918 RepID=W5MJT4_LEPOC